MYNLMPIERTNYNTIALSNTEIILLFIALAVFLIILANKR